MRVRKVAMAASIHLFIHQVVAKHLLCQVSRVTQTGPCPHGVHPAGQRGKQGVRKASQAAREAQPREGAPNLPPTPTIDKSVLVEAASVPRPGGSLEIRNVSNERKWAESFGVCLRAECESSRQMRTEKHSAHLQQ